MMKLWSEEHKGYTIVSADLKYNTYTSHRVITEVNKSVASLIEFAF